MEFICDNCGHSARVHLDRLSDSALAPCMVEFEVTEFGGKSSHTEFCSCEDFESEAADNAESDEAVRQAWDVVPPGWDGVARG